MKIVTRLDFSLFDDEELDKIISTLHAERERRHDAKVADGTYPPPLVNELQMKAAGAIVAAIRAYRDRVGDIVPSVVAAKRVFDKYPNNVLSDYQLVGSADELSAATRS